MNASSPIVLFTPDLAFGGGIARVHQAAARALGDRGYAVHTVQVGSLGGPRVSVLNRAANIRMRADHGTLTSVQAFLPELHVTPLLSARIAVGRVLREIRPAQVIAVGAMLPYAWSVLGHGVPVSSWAATTLLNERKVQWAGFGRAQAAVHRATLPAMLRAERRVMEASVRLAAMSRYGATSFTGLVPRHVAVVYPPVFDPFCVVAGDTEARRAALDGGELRLIFVGRTRDPRKRFDRALAVAGRVAELSRLRVTFSVTAAASDLPPVRKLGNVEVVALGRPSDDELSQALRASHWVLMTSDQEGFGIAVAEAMMCGVPVASTPCGGPDAEILVSGGGVVAPAAELAERLWAVTSDADRWAHVSACGTTFAEKHFSPAVASAAFLDAVVVPT